MSANQKRYIDGSIEGVAAIGTLAIALIYMLSFSYQAGFGQFYGIEFIDLGIESVISSVKYFIYPVIFFISAIFVICKICVDFSVSTSPVRTLMPVILCFCIYPTQGERLGLVQSDQIFWLVSGTYFILEGVFYVMTNLAPSDARKGNKILAWFVQCMLLLGGVNIYAWQFGRAMASEEDTYQICDEEGKSVFLFQSGELVICARLDRTNGNKVVGAIYRTVGDDKDKAFKTRYERIGPVTPP